MDLFAHEHLKVKSMNDISARLLKIDKMKAWEVRKVIKDETKRRIASGDVPKALLDNPASVKKKHISQLVQLLRNFAKTTNEKHGREYFREDIEQRLLNWEDVQKAWPLETEIVEYRVYKPKDDKHGPAVKQTIYEY